MPSAAKTRAIADVDDSNEASNGRQLRIAMVTPSWPPGSQSNGIISYVSRLQPELLRRGHEAVVVSMSDSGEDCSSVANVRPYWPFWARMINAAAHRLGSTAPLVRSELKGLVRLISQLQRSRGIELVEMEEAFGNAHYVARTTNMPVVVRLHGPWFLTGLAGGVADDDRYRTRVEAERVAIATAAGVSAPSRAVLDAVREFYGLPLSDAEVIANPIEPARRDELWNAEKASTNTILFVGRFNRLKGGDLVLRAFDRVVEQFDAARLVFIGPDFGISQNNGDRVRIREFMRNTMSEKGSNAVEWIGPQCAETIDQFRRQAAVTVVASRYETFSYTVLEAMRLGCPLVTTRTGGIPEVLGDQPIALVAAPENPEDLAAKILALLRDRRLATRIGADAALEAERRFHPRTIVEQKLRFYGRVLGRARAGG